MKRVLVSAFLCCFAISAPSCQAQFFKKLGQELMNGATGQNSSQYGTPAGNTSMPAGQYMMTNMGTGQAFYITVDNNGQMFASQPNNNMAPGMVQPAVGQPGVPGMMQGLTQPGAMQPSAQGQQQGMGGMMKGALGNFLRNELTPNQAAPVQQQY